MAQTGVREPARRGLLKRGVVGIGALAAFLAGGNAAKAARPAPGGGSISLFGRSWYSSSPHLGAGESPDEGDRVNVYGELTDADGTKVGEYYAAAFCISSPYRGPVIESGAMEMQTLALADGSIVGMGAGSGAERTYAVVGGTGRYVGARGSYVARQDPSDGSIEFRITLV